MVEEADVDDEVEVHKHFLLTELDENDYDSFDFSFFNDPKTRTKNRDLLTQILSSQDLEDNEKDYDTDLEGRHTLTFTAYW